MLKTRCINIATNNSKKVLNVNNKKYMSKNIYYCSDKVNFGCKFEN